jgi:SAM-dependent methyltransferase
MSLELRRREELGAQQLAKLEAAMLKFYQNPPASYYQTSDCAAQRYSPREQPFHCDLVQQIVAGTSVVELGCGTAHLCTHVEARGGTYTGLDHGESILQQNALRFPKARFFRIGTTLRETFDIAASLYTIEHVVDPPTYLDEMWRLCRPGGLLAIICPEFVECPVLPPSVFYGKTARRLREKLRTLSLGDTLQHLLDLKVRGVRWKRLAVNEAPGAFWINLLPRVLHGAGYEIDADAVHLPRRLDLVWYLQRKGAVILRTSAEMNDVSSEILRFNCYVLARKPESETVVSSGQPFVLGS